MAGSRRESYPSPARSYLLRNEGGRFTDVTAEVAPELAQPHGMVTAAVWTDYDGDGRLDLVTAGEWTGIEFYHNDGRRLVPTTVGLPPSRGWWWSLAAGDFNGDGRPDLIAGNLGLNFMFQTSPESRFGVYAGHFAETQTSEIVLTQEIGGKEYPVFGSARLGPTIYSAALRFPTYAGFAAATVEQLFGTAALKRALHLQTDTFASVYLQNNGDGTFAWMPLPSLAQIAPIRGIVVRDLDGDGKLDALVAGNLTETEANIPPADAGNGLWLRGDGRGHFTPVSPFESGFLAPGSVAGLAHVKTPAGSAVLGCQHRRLPAGVYDPKAFAPLGGEPYHPVFCCSRSSVPTRLSSICTVGIGYRAYCGPYVWARLRYGIRIFSLAI